MITGQLSLKLAPENETKTHYVICQPEGVLIPWTVQVTDKGLGKLKVTIYHEKLPNGQYNYHTMKLNARSFTDFIVKQLKMWHIFHPEIKVRSIDAVALYQGFI